MYKKKFVERRQLQEKKIRIKIFLLNKQICKMFLLKTFRYQQQKIHYYMCQN